MKKFITIIALLLSFNCFCFESETIKALLKIDEVDQMKNRVEYKTKLILTNMLGNSGKNLTLFGLGTLATQEIKFKGDLYKDIDYETELNLDTIRISFNLEF